jgi:hypothetical protein
MEIKNVSKTWLKVLRGFAIALFGITILLTIIGGAGTVCLAFNAENFEGFEALVPYKWLYQIFVYIKFIIGFIGIYTTYALIKGRKTSYRNAVILLISGVLVAAAQMITSHIVRGKTLPVDMRFYVTLFTLIIFLIIRTKSIWSKIDFFKEKSVSSQSTIISSAMVVMGIITLTTPIWAQSSHITPSGENLVNVLAIPLMFVGTSLIVGGIAILFYSIKKMKQFSGELNFEKR